MRIIHLLTLIGCGAVIAVNPQPVEAGSRTLPGTFWLISFPEPATRLAFVPEHNLQFPSPIVTAAAHTISDDYCWFGAAELGSLLFGLYECLETVGGPQTDSGVFVAAFSQFFIVGTTLSTQNGLTGFFGFRVLTETKQGNQQTDRAADK